MHFFAHTGLLAKERILCCQFSHVTSKITDWWFSRRYANLASAASKSDGLAVLGVFFHIQRGDNQAWSDLLTSLEKLKEAHQTVESYLGVPLRSFVPSNPEDFYRYSGSLTTPGCFESVTWTVFSHSLPISESQMSFFRSLEDGLQQPLVNNFRPVQPLNER